MKTSKSSFKLVLLMAAFLSPALLHAALPLETETARLPPKGTFEFNTAFEFQTSKEGKEFAVPAALEYGALDNLALLIEPVFYTAIRPKAGTHTSGIGDLEATVQYLFLNESASVPALAIAGEVKFPTAANDLIGTGQTDYTPYLIASKRVGDFDFHANLGYTFLGKPSGVSVQNTFDYAVAAEWLFNAKWNFIAEVYGHSSASKNTSDGGDGVTPVTVKPAAETAGIATDGAMISTGGSKAATPEISGSETVGTVGLRYHTSDAVALSLGVSYDNKHAWLISPGFTITF